MIPKLNYTQIPNAILDCIHSLKPSEAVLIMVVCRQTLGWQRDTAAMSLNFLERQSGLSRPTLIWACRSLEEKGWIKKTTDEECVLGSIYELNIDREELDSVCERSPDCAANLTVGGKESLLGGGKESLLGGGKESLPPRGSPYIGIKKVLNKAKSATFSDPDAVARGSASVKEKKKLLKADRDRLALDIYQAYPRKVAKPTAILAISKALGRGSSFEAILGATKRFSEFWAGADSAQMQFCPYPASWFNQDRFNDEPSTWQVPKEVKKEFNTARSAISWMHPGSCNF